MQCDGESGWGRMPVDPRTLAALLDVCAFFRQNALSNRAPLRFEVGSA